MTDLLLRDERIIATIAKLQQRISDRFPHSGLANLCGDIYDVSQDAADRAEKIRQPIVWIRVTGYALAVCLIALIVVMIVYAAQTVGIRDEDMSFDNFIQTFDAAASGGLFIGAAIYFLTSLEKRIKRGQALAAVHELRSIAHIIDMHQLTKDPERLFGSYQGTSHSPKETMTPLQLGRYLDYCTEMLSLNGKIAALYVNQFDDSEVVAAVGEIEQLCTGLSRKIWQKIMVLNRHRTMSLSEESTPMSLPVEQAERIESANEEDS
ncbi:hypothetical protein [Stieleria marina]|uniref:Uncharacterized protein n=1 Tax=Stieleria marina TaxID=1930275 RepID=A0A517NMH6_9BACT|nr:hypothetical protein K239x_02740 [Planctomycetes bacterium K23_9]